MRGFFPILAIVPMLTSCDAIFDSMIDSVFESKRDRNLREDSRNLKRGRPLQHHSSERRLKVDRENRLFEDLSGGF